MAEMYVCVCAPATESQIQKAIDEGADTLDKLRVEVGVCCQCQSCYADIIKMLEQS